MARDFVPTSSGIAAQLQALVVPALRKHREGRGTHFVGDASGIKAWATRQAKFKAGPAVIYQDVVPTGDARLMGGA